MLRLSEAARQTFASGLDSYLHWQGKLNEYNGDWRRAEMVRAFIEPFEYGDRFGP